jgi:hypothetical protein
VENSTGIFFDRPTVESLRGALDAAGGRSWNRPAIRSHAAGFSRQRFIDEFRAALVRVRE